ncbi:hypothetical protein FACS189490_04120 [Clostridia bacterium]|nr:hypothetical protein FACS189490_04120 [Clostridia bacterium]
MGKSKNTRISSGGKWRSVDGCRCGWCRWYKGKKSGCALEECCCAEERADAYRRERDAKLAANARKREREEPERYRRRKAPSRRKAGA